MFKPYKLIHRSQGIWTILGEDFKERGQAQVLQGGKVLVPTSLPDEWKEEIAADVRSRQKHRQGCVVDEPDLLEGY